MKISTTPQFRRVVKKMHPAEKAALDAAVQTLVAQPEIGEMKVGDLRGIRVHKYQGPTQVMLLAYEIVIEDEVMVLLLVGAHENVYRDLKRH